MSHTAHTALLPWQRTTLALYRVIIGALFACHGAADLFGLPGVHTPYDAPVPFASWPEWWAAMIELVGGLLVTIGLGTRVAALVCSGAMAYAYFIVHQPTGVFPLVNGGEKAALFCWAFLLVATLGPGRWSVTHAFRRRRRLRDTLARDGSTSAHSL